MSTKPRWSDLISLDRGRTLTAANHLLPAWVSLVIVILIGWQLAKIVWMFAPGTEAGAAVDVPPGQAGPVSVSNRTAGGQNTAQQIADASIFGTADPDAPLEIIDFPEGPKPDETGRNLTLKGTHASARAEFSIAIIAEGGDDEKVYSIGDPVGSGVELHAVHADHVVLNEGGALTSLSLPDEFADSPSPIIRRAAISRQANPNRASIQSVVAQNVSRLADVIRPTPYFVSGQQQGYRVYPGRNRAQFASLGLRPGDLIKEIDGQSLTDPTQAMQIFQSLGTADQVSVTLERNGTAETVILKTDQLDLGNDNTK